MKLGIIQGRLSKPVNDKIQEFPKDTWENEFFLLRQLNLNHIEWIITKDSFNDGITNLDIKKYSKNVSSICCDHIIDEKISELDFLYERLSPICDWAEKNNILSITIPLLEESKITENNKKKLFENLILFSNNHQNMNFNFEIESDIFTCLELVKQTNNFFLVCDTGNLTSCGYSVCDWINSGFDYIRHIHLKDKTIHPSKTVEPNNGDTDFKKIFDLLNKKNYNYYYTIQTCRGSYGKETETIERHIKIFKDLYGT